MADKDRIDVLKTRHQELESEIEREFESSTPADLLIATLKRQKLRIKDELAELNAL